MLSCRVVILWGSQEAEFAVECLHPEGCIGRQFLSTFLTLGATAVVSMASGLVAGTEHTLLCCRTEDGIVNRWLFVRYLVIGLYVGCVTCAGFAWWYTWAPVSHIRLDAAMYVHLIKRVADTAPPEHLALPYRQTWYQGSSMPASGAPSVASTCM